MSNYTHSEEERSQANNRLLNSGGRINEAMYQRHVEALNSLELGLYLAGKIDFVKTLALQELGRIRNWNGDEKILIETDLDREKYLENFSNQEDYWAFGKDPVYILTFFSSDKERRILPVVRGQMSLSDYRVLGDNSGLKNILSNLEEISAQEWESYLRDEITEALRFRSGSLRVGLNLKVLN